VLQSARDEWPIVLMGGANEHRDEVDRGLSDFIEELVKLNPSFSGPTGSNFVGPTGSNFVGPTGSNFVGPTGSNFVGPTGSNFVAVDFGK